MIFQNVWFQFLLDKTEKQENYRQFFSQSSIQNSAASISLNIQTLTQQLSPFVRYSNDVKSNGQ